MVFLVFFTIICCTILTNLFIAMISKTIGDIQDSAKQQYKFNLAWTVAYYGSKESIPPPFNLLHLGATATSAILKWLCSCIAALRHVCPITAPFSDWDCVEQGCHIMVDSPCGHDHHIHRVEGSH